MPQLSSGAAQRNRRKLAAPHPCTHACHASYASDSDFGSCGHRAARLLSRCGSVLRAVVQRVVTALTGLSGDAAGVSVLRQLSRSSVSAPEHVGKQYDGIAGWRAACDSAGIAGPDTGVDERGNTGEQLATNSVSGTSIIARRAGLLDGRIGNLRLCRCPALFLEAGTVHCVDLCQRLVALFRGMLGTQLGELLAHPPAIDGPTSTEQQRCDHHQADQAPRHRTNQPIQDSPPGSGTRPA